MNDFLQVATYNVAHCRSFLEQDRNAGAERVDIPQIANVIKGFNADMVGVNELYSLGDESRLPDRANQPAKLGAAAGFPYQFFARAYKFSSFEDIGNAVYSRYPIVKAETVFVPTTPKETRQREETNCYEDRVAVAATIDVDGKLVTMISVHAGCNLSERLRMQEALIAYLDGLNTPVILTGDFNARPHSPELAKIRERLVSAADVVGKTDELTCPSFDPRMTIDYIFVSKEFEVTAFEVIKTYESDHFPVRATLKFK